MGCTEVFSRGGRIRTYDLHIPNVARYRATLHPDRYLLFINLNHQTRSESSRGGRIRTYDLHIPNVARYRATLHPDRYLFFRTAKVSIQQPEKKKFKTFLRRGRDSNPRYRYQYDSLANCSFRPLRHLSIYF